MQNPVPEAASAHRSLAQQLQLRRWVKPLSVVTTVGMFIVLVMGTLVTNTNSAEGCGRDWPLCHGKFIPDFAISTFIEFSHRAITGIETLLVLALTVGVVAFWRSRLEIKILAPGMIVFLLLQAALGALAVKFPESPPVLALHFGVSLISFVTVLLTMCFLFEVEGQEKLRDRPTPRGFSQLVWGLVIYTYAVAYSGALVRHENVSLACNQWPLCANNQLFPLYHNGMLVSAIAVVLTHRVAAFVLLGGAIWLAAWGRRIRNSRPDLYWGSVAALALVIIQALEGAFVVFQRVSVVSALGHGIFIALFFGALCYLALHVFARPQAVRRASWRADRDRAKATRASDVRLRQQQRSTAGAR